MTTKDFVWRYLQSDIPVTLHFSDGEIIYEGKMGNVPYRMLRHTNFKSVSGLGEDGDLLICVEATPEYHEWNKRVRED